jgi:hypothetical protein
MKSMNESSKGYFHNSEVFLEIFHVFPDSKRMFTALNGLPRGNGATFDRLFLKLDWIRKFRSDAKR